MGAAPIITGAVQGVTVTVLTSTPMQTMFAQAILESVDQGSTLVTGAGGSLTQHATVDISKGGSLLVGSASVLSFQVLLDGQYGSYMTEGTSISIVVAADNSNSNIVNSNPSGGLLAITGAGINTLNGETGTNQFTTGVNGLDSVFLNGSSNQLTSNGADTVQVGGPSTITASVTGVDRVLLTSATTLTFINNSAASVIDSITGAANGTITLAGTGNTSVTAGGGPETFFVDTSAGNVTLNGGSQTTDTFEFTKDANAGTAQGVVNNFAAGDRCSSKAMTVTISLRNPGTLPDRC